MAGTSKTDGPPSWWPFVACMVAVVAILGVASTVMLDLRRQIGLQAEDGARNLFKAVERDVGRNIEMLDLSLQGVLEGIARPDVLSADPAIRNLVLFDRSATASRLGALVAVNTRGEIVFDSNSLVPRVIKPVTDRDYFQAQVAKDVGLFISRPYRSRLIDKQVLGLSRRISRADGSFAGVALGTIEVSYFTDLLASLNLGADAIVSLVRTDGAVLFRHGRTEPVPKTDIGQAEVFQRMLREGSGTFSGVSKIDGIERLYVFGRIADQPLILTIGLGAGDIYAAWTGKAALTAIVLLAICIGIIALTLVLTAQLRHRAVAERKLTAANAELAELSVTDGLTGLANRRWFDECLERELRRAQRTQSRLWLILMDVDYFKLYNDQYGHPAGDSALQAVAGVFRTVARRPTDLVFRVGGEEFAILLLDMSASAAAGFAEDVRRRIGSLGLPHERSPHAVLTISVGVTEIGGMDAAFAIEKADALLYRAKHAGRDRVAFDQNPGRLRGIHRDHLVSIAS